MLLRVGDREELSRLVRSSSVRAGLAQRARIVLLASDGVLNADISDRVGVSRPTVNRWRPRYVEAGSAAFSTDPELAAKVNDVIGLYLAPPENAIVLCVDEKSQIQALNRTQKVLPMQPGRAEPSVVTLGTHDYVRHGTTTLFAVLEVATGKVTGLCKDRHRHQEFLIFRKHLARAYPDCGDGAELYLVMDYYATHKQVEVCDWLAANPRIHVHFTPTSGSWPNLVEVWFGIIERQALRRGAFPSVRDLMIKIRAFINGWNTRKDPFVRTKTSDDVLATIKRKQTLSASH